MPPVVVVTQRQMALRERGGKLKGAVDGLLGLRESLDALIQSAKSIPIHGRVFVSQTRVRKGEVRVQLHGLRIHVDCRTDIALEAGTVRVGISPEQEFVRLEVVGRDGLQGHSLPRQHRHPERIRYSFGNFGLHLEDAGAVWFLVGLCPDVSGPLSANELWADPHATRAAGMLLPTNRAFDYVIGAELLAD